MENINAIEEGAAQASAPSSSDGATPSRRKGLLLGAVVLAAVLALSFGLGFGLSRDKGNNTDSNTSLQRDGNAKDAASKTNGSSADTLSNTTTSTGSPTTSNTTNGSPTTSNPIGGGNPITFASRLTTISNDTIKQTYASCDSLNEDLMLLGRHIANRTIASNEWYFDQQNMYPYEQPLDDGGVVADGSTMNTGAPEFESAPAESSTTKSVSESNFGTNNQVEGVDEGDLVQSNGEQVFVVYGTEIIELAADAVTVTRRTKVPASETDGCNSGYIASMLLIDERLVVVATTYCDTIVANADVSTSDISYYGQEANNVYIYDTSDMSLVETVPLRGSFLSARAIGDNVHLVTTTYFDTYLLTQYLEPWRDDIYGVNTTKAQYRAKAQEQVEEHLQEFVAALIQGLDCTSLQKLSLFQNSDDNLNFSFVLDTISTVTSFVATGALESKSTASMMLPSGGYTVYASADYLILAVQGWWVDDAATQQTFLVSYKLSGSTSNATSLGTVPGYVLNQFSIDHFVQDGGNYLRVASTTLAQWAEVNEVWEETTNSTSQVTILKMDDETSQMSVVGTVMDLGKAGETIYSVRFMGDRGFVTTFEVTDPFYTLDLSDPNNPLKAGELEIPGYSSYLHPIGNDLIIGVGQSTDSNGTSLGVQISLFDVSNFSNPVRIQTFTDMGGINMSAVSYSEVEYEFKAFRYLNDSQLLIIPITIYSYSPCNYTYNYPVGNDTWIAENATTATDGNVDTSKGSSDPVDSEIFIDPAPGSCSEPSGGYDGFRVYEVTTDGIASYLSIQHDIGDWYTSCWSSAYLPTRSLVFDGDLMTLKSHSILSHDLSTKTTDATPVNLDDVNTICESYIV